MRCFLWFKKKKEESLGEKGENIAAQYLKKKGFKIIGRNFKTPFGKRLGEIDIIAQKNKELIFVEVKTRVLNCGNNILPEESITPSKLHKLNIIANFYLKNNRLSNTNYHFDAISIWVDGTGKNAKIRHLENIFY